MYHISRKVFKGVCSNYFGFGWMGEEWITVRVDNAMKEALEKAVKRKKLALNPSDYARDAIRKKLREDGLL